MTKKKQPPSSSDLGSALAQTRAELGRLARALLADDGDAARELYDAEKRNEARLIAMLDEAMAAEEQARKDAEQSRIRPLREEFERLEAVTRPGYLDQALRERYFPALERLFLDLHELEAEVGKTIAVQKAAAVKCGELADKMGTSWGMPQPFTSVETVRHRGREYLEMVLRDTPGLHGEMAAWFPRVAAPRKAG